MNLANGSQILTPNLSHSKKTLLCVPDIMISSHCWIWPFSVQSRFAIIQVFDMSAAVKCWDSLYMIAVVKQKFVFGMQWLRINVTHQILYNRGQLGHVLEEEQEVEEGEVEEGEGEGEEEVEEEEEEEEEEDKDNEVGEEEKDLFNQN